MSITMTQIIPILLHIIFVLHFVFAKKLEKRLSPIKVQNDGYGTKSEAPLDSKSAFQSIIDTLKGKVVETPVAKQISETDGLEYDSLDDIQYVDDEHENNPLVRGKKNIKQWDHWGQWSDCSVTCGVGKTVRWRHCVSAGCANGEKEAQIKTCTMKACP